MGHPEHKPWRFLKSLFLLSPLIIGIPSLTLWNHYDLPKPVQETYNTASDVPQLSERAILEHAKYLSEDIGYRTVGTREHALADAWMLKKAEELKTLCEDIVRKEPGRKLQCEVDRQTGNGEHRFDIMSARLYKTYVNLANIVVRISDGTPEGKEHAVLINAHLDSTLPSPGAADDALAVGAMLEVARTLVSTRGWTPEHSIILLFNTAEESLQDASHLFGTLHPWRHTVRAVLNLEAAGTRGRTLLFQATSQQMINAYSQVPRPLGTIVANDVFSSGIIMSDTDFRQFELYMNVTGLDMAVVGHSYFYHTRKDLVRYIEPGVAQHMGDNTLALVRYLSSEESPLPTLTTGYLKPTTVFFSFLGVYFIRYSFATANAMHFVFLAANMALISLTSSSVRTVRVKKDKQTIKSTNNGFVSVSESSEIVTEGGNVWSDVLKGALVIVLGFASALISVHIVALVMVHLFNRPLSWFRYEASCLLLYGPPALFGGLATHAVLQPLLRVSEKSLLQALLLLNSLLAIVLQLVGIGSAILFFAAGLSIFAGLLVDAIKGGEHPSLLVYAFGQFIPFLYGTELFVIVSDIFVPLTGRMGGDTPAEHIIATIVALTGSYLMPLVIPFFHRFGRRSVLRSLTHLALLSSVMILLFTQLNPFDAMHPRRVFVVHNENVTSNEVFLGVGTADISPNFEDIANNIASFVKKNASATATANVMNEYNGDWDVMYPFSTVIKPFNIQLDPYPSNYADGRFSVSAINDIVDTASATRSLTLVIQHPGLIWTTIAFDAHVLSWSLDKHPLPAHARHFVKQASFYGEDTWSLDLVISYLESEKESPKLRVNFHGIRETAMWPGKASEKHLGGRAMEIFEELDNYLIDKYDDALDVTLLGCVGGIVEL